MITPGGETGGSILPLISCVTEPRAQHHGAWGFHVLAFQLSFPSGAYGSGRGRMLMVLWGQQAGGRWVVEDSRHRAWVWGFFSGPELSPGTLGSASPLCRVIPHPNPSPTGSCLQSFPLPHTITGLVRVKPCPFACILGCCFLSSTKANRRVSCWNALP